MLAYRFILWQAFAFSHVKHDPIMIFEATTAALDRGEKIPCRSKDVEVGHLAQVKLERVAAPPGGGRIQYQIAGYIVPHPTNEPKGKSSFVETHFHGTTGAITRVELRENTGKENPH